MRGYSSSTVLSDIYCVYIYIYLEILGDNACKCVYTAKKRKGGRKQVRLEGRKGVWGEIKPYMSRHFVVL